MKASHEHAPAKHSQRSAATAPMRKPAVVDSPALAARGLTHDALGNRGLMRALRGRSRGQVSVSKPGDAVEHAADRTANAVINAAATSAVPPAASPRPHAVVRHLSGGQGLDERTRALMESRFGESFADVRIHAGQDAADSAASLKSRAFTVGSDIVFGNGQFSPGTTAGQRLLAHELAHVVQQRRTVGPLATTTDAERDAREAASVVASGGARKIELRAAPGIVQKHELDPEVSRSVSKRTTDDTVRYDFMILVNSKAVIVLSGRRQEDALAFQNSFDSATRTLTIRAQVNPPSGNQAYVTALAQEACLERAEHATITVAQNDPIHEEFHRSQPLPEIPLELPPIVIKPVPPKPKPRVPGPRPTPAPKEAPRPTPAPELPPPEPKAAEAEPETARPVAPAAKSRTEELQDALSRDRSKVPEAAGKLSDPELASLDMAQRRNIIEAIGEHGSTSDASTLLRLMLTTPDRDAGDLADWMNTDNGRLLREFSSKFSTAANLQLGLSTMDLAARRIDPRPLTGAAVMGSEYFGGQSWIYTYQMSTELPVPWHLGSEQRGLRAEPLITQEFYTPLNPVVLPRGMPAADISFGGKYEPIEGTTRLTVGGQTQRVGFAGWRITGSTIVSYKTIEMRSPGLAKPGALNNELLKYLEQLASRDYLPKTDIERSPGLPRFRVEIVDPADRIMHLQLSAEPDELQAQELARFKEAARSLSVQVVIFGPPSAGKSTVITPGGAPAPAYIPSAPPLTVSPKFEQHQALGQGSLLAAQVVFSALNSIGGSIQEASAREEFNKARDQAAKVLEEQPDTGASIWVTWYPSDAPWFSANQPGPRFGGVQVVYEREPSPSPDVHGGLYEDNPGGRQQQRVWIPPRSGRPPPPVAERDATESLQRTGRWMERLQKQIDELGAETRIQRAWRDRIGRVDVHVLDRPRAEVSSAQIAIQQGRFADAEQSLYRARELLRDADNMMRRYQALPPR